MRKSLQPVALLALLLTAGPLQLAAAQEILVYDGFENEALESPDYVAEGINASWSFTSSDPDGGLVEVVSTIGDVNPAAYEDFRAVAMGRRNDGEFTTNALDLHLDLEGQDQVELRFAIRDVSDDTHAEDGLYFSSDGGVTFRPILAFDPSNWTNEYGELPPIDVDARAADAGLPLSSTFVIRFQQGGIRDFAGNAFGADGFLIDEVSVRAAPVTYAALPFEDDFEADSLGPAWSWGNALGSCSEGVHVVD